MQSLSMVYDCKQILITDFKAVGVEFAKNGGFQYTVSANKEVILSAGAINSPHLLMLSGIGPKEELENHHVGIHTSCYVPWEWEEESICVWIF